MSCLEVRTLLPLRPLGVLEADEETLVATHLGACEACRGDALRHDEAYAAFPPAGEVPEGKAAELWERIGAAVAPKAIPITLACSFCHGALARPEACYCASCLAPHHEDCFRTHGRCSAPGCQDTRVVRPAAVARPRRVRRLVAAAAVVALGGGVAALTRGSPPERTTTIEVTTIEVTAREEPVRDVLGRVARQVGVNVAIAPEVSGALTLGLERVAPGEAVQTVAALAGCEVTTIAPGVLLVERARRVTIATFDGSVRGIVQEIARQSGRTILVARDIGGTTTFVVKERPWDRALAELARELSLEIGRVGDVVLVSRRVLRGAVPLAVAERPPLPAPVRASPLDIAVEDADLRDVMDEIGRRVGRGIVVEPDVDEKLSLELRGVSWEDAVLVAGRLSGCRVESRGAAVVLARPPRNELHARETPVRAWLELLAAEAGLELVVEGDALGAVSADAEGFWPLDLIRATCVLHGFGYELDGRVIRIRTGWRR